MLSFSSTSILPCSATVSKDDVVEADPSSGKTVGSDVVSGKAIDSGTSCVVDSDGAKSTTISSNALIG